VEALGPWKLQGSRTPWMLTSVEAYGSAEPAGEHSAGPQSTPAEMDSSARQVGRKLAPGEIDFKSKQLIMMFTCGQCEVRSAKAFSKAAYQSGVVIVECPGCGGRHLIADHLGWFGEKGTVEDFAKERGNTAVAKTADGTVELTPDDVLGSARVEAKKNSNGGVD